MTINEEMYKEFSNVVIGEDSISNDALLQVLKDYAGTVSVFDLMEINAELIEEITASDMMGIISGNDVKAGTYEFIDTTAIQMIKRSNLETVIANGNEPQNLIRAIKGEKIGTRVISE